MGVMHVSQEQWDQMMASFERADKWRADQMPDEQAALNVMFQAWLRLKELGWREAMYAPKGEPLEVIEAGSTGVHKAERDEKDRFWVHDGDMWPARPILFRLEHGIAKEVDRT